MRSVARMWVEVGAQDPVVVEAGDVVERPARSAPRPPRRGPGRRAGSNRISKSSDQQPGDVDVVAQRALDVVERERRVPLPHVLRVGAQHGRLPPGQPGAEHQRVEAVDLVVAVPDRADRVLEQLARVVRQRAAVAQAELVDVRRPVQAVELVGPLVDDLDAHRRQHRQHAGQRQRRADPVDLEPRLAAAGVEVLVQRQVDAGAVLADRRSPPAGRGRPRRPAARSPPCRPPGTSSGSAGPARCRPARRTRRAPRW